MEDEPFVVCLVPPFNSQEILEYFMLRSSSVRGIAEELDRSLNPPLVEVGRGAIPESTFKGIF